jgi:hypothetical protein
VDWVILWFPGLCHNTSGSGNREGRGSNVAHSTKYEGDDGAVGGHEGVGYELKNAAGAVLLRSNVDRDGL